jgi:formyltetrahydrofolate hydrolase
MHKEKLNMAKIIHFPALDSSDWHKYEQDVRNDLLLNAEISHEGKEYIIRRFKAIFDDLPKNTKVEVDLAPLSHLSTEDIEIVVATLRQSINEILKQVKLGAVLGEIFLLLTEIAKLKEEMNKSFE